MTIRAAIYVRVSTTRQAERDLSLPDQIAQCRAWCEAKGWQVAEVFSEPGASALDDDRPVFQELIFKATRPEQPFDHVVVHSLSRFSRDSLHSELYVRQLRKAGVSLVSITQDIGQDASGEFIRKVLNVFDEHQSRENAKHVHRAMMENARQGFWNGSRPPFGYGLRIAERRGTRDKKVLVIDEAEAEIVREMFALATGAQSRPMGVKAIATHLNQRGVTRRGRPFMTGGVHAILTSTTYIGRHQFNRRDSRNGTVRPPSEWIELAVPAIIDQAAFDAVQRLLQSRNPKRTPPRVANGPTLLAGLARCGHCGAAMIQNTGKGGAYRYYACSTKIKQGTAACPSKRIRMDRLDEQVIATVTAQALNPDYLTDLLQDYLKAASARDQASKDKLAKLKAQATEAGAAITRLLSLVETGAMAAADPDLRDRLVGLRLRRDELSQQATALQRRIAEGEPELTEDAIARLAAFLKEKLKNGSPELKQAYARLVLSEVAVSDDAIRITGSKTRLAKAAAAEMADTPMGVLSFVREWRPRLDSNQRPSD
jgi:site-specific DNA recombinase